MEMMCDSKPAASDNRIQIDLNRTMMVGNLYHMFILKLSWKKATVLRLAIEAVKSKLYNVVNYKVILLLWWLISL